MASEPIISANVSEFWHGAGIVMLIGVVLGFSSATAPASAPTMFQDNGAAATLASALNSALKGALMEATITTPASNGTWLATISADAVGGAIGNGINDYTVRIA